MIEMIDPKALTVLVTGATSGFGAAACRRFAGAGAKVIATGRRRERLAALKNELGGLCHTVAFDARDRAETEAAFSSLPEAFARPNVVVANAGLALGLEPAHRADLGRRRLPLSGRQRLRRHESVRQAVRAEPARGPARRERPGDEHRAGPG